MAIGQLADYWRYEDPDTTRRILLTSRPRARISKISSLERVYRSRIGPVMDSVSFSPEVRRRLWTIAAAKPAPEA